MNKLEKLVIGAALGMASLPVATYGQSNQQSMPSIQGFTYWTGMEIEIIKSGNVHLYFEYHQKHPDKLKVVGQFFRKCNGVKDNLPFASATAEVKEGNVGPVTLYIDNKPINGKPDE